MGLLVHPLVYDPEAVENLEREEGGQKVHPLPMLIHTPSQIVYSSIPHKFQEGYKIFISTTDKYSVFIDNCGMTQSIVFILCSNEEEAKKYLEILEHPLYLFINNICRWGNFNNIRILQSFPIPTIEYSGIHKDIYDNFNITKEEIEFINYSL
jgi:hypothetical protein